ncbi:response regulator [Marinomonas mediterranea]|jgi:Response regulator containing a CheY-like receiver domain and an HD-GYP domain|uniref:Putative PAS/PAC sensor protein n=1 Tax=Marinomonas mediterranea (strain ATCC 700492 / JCM 21426 / NBRC 103028 / MMB-1) TaxID=717774 RepID=F2JV92_MARM1|nr:response regulator [Marinomonas mediterranea]ADZ92850.1 putative PAS/PAC sensor protein [Marinomonas mediterranea MMB-1]WCN10784.1 response regulator [Marinomonas mediterranea]WCN18873.1 response regulator [Marinomonas mediterranea MMB-1]
MRNVLLVDDENQILMALKRVLRKQEYNVITAQGGENGLAVLKETPIDLILSDYMMPGLSGTDFLEKAEKMQPDSIRMILSGHSDFESVMESLKSGVVHKYLVKPWNNEELIDQINQSLAGKLEGDQESDESVDSIESSDVSPLTSSSMQIESTLEHEILSVNETLAGSLGYTADELVGKPIQSLLADRSYQQHLASIEDKANLQEDWEVPAQTRIAQTSQDTFFPVSLCVKRYGDKLIYGLDVIEMNTSRNDELKQSLKAIEGAYIVVNRNGKIIRCSQAMRGLLDSSLRIQVGESLSDFIGSLQFHELLQGMSKALDLNLSFKCLDNGLIVIVCEVPPSKEKATQDDALSGAQVRINEEMVAFMRETVLSPLSALAATELTEDQKQQLSAATEACNRMLTAITNIACRE